MKNIMSGLVSQHIISHTYTCRTILKHNMDIIYARVKDRCVCVSVQYAVKSVFCPHTRFLCSTYILHQFSDWNVGVSALNSDQRRTRR